MKDEILEAVAAALADLRKERAAELVALRAEIDEMREQDHARTEAVVDDAARTIAEALDPFEARLEKNTQDLEALSLAARTLGDEVANKADTARVDEAMGATQATIALWTDAAEETAQKTRDTISAAFEKTLEAALAPLESDLQTRATNEALNREMALMGTRIDAAATEFGEQLATKATTESIVEAVSPVRDQLAALETTVEVVADGVAEVDAQVGAKASDEAVQVHLAILQSAIDTRASVEYVDTAAEDVAKDVSGMRQDLEQEHLVNQERATALIAEFDATLKGEVATLSTAIDARASIDYVDTVVGDVAKSVTSMRQDFGVEHLESEALLRTQVEGIESGLEEAVTKINSAIAEKASPADYDTLLGTLRSEMIERYQNAEEWARGGPAYKRHALVTHRGALWQALETTTDEPDSMSPTWMLLADALETVEMARNGEGDLVLTSKMASGRTQEFSVVEPIPTFKGVYDPDTIYEPWDTAAKDSHVFLCLQTTRAAPGENLGEWQVFSGPRGAKGRAGKDGSHGISPPEVDEDALVTRVMHQVVPQLQDVVDAL